MSDLHDITQPGKRDTLLLALLRQSRMRCRDELVEMMLRRIRRTQAAAKEQLEDLHDQHRATEESLIGIFGQVLETEQTQDTDAEFGRQVRLLLSEQGGAAALAEQCETVSAWHRGNDLPLLWPIHAKHRVLLFRLLDLMDVQSATQDRSLLDALAVVSRLRHARRDEVEGDTDLSFASQRWRAFVAKRRAKPGILDRRALEVCVFVHLADALQTGDLFIVEVVRWSCGATGRVPRSAQRRVSLFFCPMRASSPNQTSTSSGSRPCLRAIASKRAGKLF